MLFTIKSIFLKIENWKLKMEWIEMMVIFWGCYRCSSCRRVAFPWRRRWRWWCRGPASSYPEPRWFCPGSISADSASATTWLIWTLATAVKALKLIESALHFRNCNFFGQFLTHFWIFFDQFSVYFWSFLDQFLGNFWIFFDQFSLYFLLFFFANFQLISQFFANFWPVFEYFLTNIWPVFKFIFE